VSTAARVAAALGVSVVSERRVARGYTPAERLVLGLADGRSVFAKAGTEKLSSEWLHWEARTYRALSAEFLPGLIAFLDDDPPVLVLEDLSDAHWPPPWRPGDVETVKRALATIRAATPPPGTPRIFEAWGELLRGNWELVAAAPQPFLGRGTSRAHGATRPTAHRPALGGAVAGAA